MSDDKRKELARLIAAKMSGGSQQIDAVRSTKGQIKGFFTKDTMYRLQQAVADQKKATEEGAGPYLAVILGLSETYLNRHSQDDDDRSKEKFAAVEKIHEAAMIEMRDWGRREAEARYLHDAYAMKTAEPKSESFSPTRMAHQTPVATEHAVVQTKFLAVGKALGDDGFNKATLKLIDKYQLTEAEVLAVKIYTSTDYNYINPATANDAARMMIQNDPDREEEEVPKAKKPGLKKSQLLIAESESDADDSQANGKHAFSQAKPAKFAPGKSQLLIADSESDTDGSEDVREDGLSNSKPAKPGLGKKLNDSGLFLSESEEESDLDREEDLEDFLAGKPPAYFATDDGKKALKRLFEEGSLHGALAISALQKMPAEEGICYRGSRMTVKDFRKRYGTPFDRKLPRYPLNNLTSLTTDISTAETFADGKGCRNPDAVVSILTKVEVKTGRDIGDLSVFGRKEFEWLLLPGTELQTDSVTESDHGDPGSPKARKWVFIEAHEV